MVWPNFFLMNVSLLLKDLIFLLLSALFPPSVCLDDILFALGRIVSTFWERAAHSVYHMFSLHFDLL